MIQPDQKRFAELLFSQRLYFEAIDFLYKLDTLTSIQEYTDKQNFAIISSYLTSVGEPRKAYEVYLIGLKKLFESDFFESNSLGELNRFPENEGNNNKNRDNKESKSNAKKLKNSSFYKDHFSQLLKLYKEVLLSHPQNFPNEKEFLYQIILFIKETVGITTKDKILEEIKILLMNLIYDFKFIFPSINLNFEQINSLLNFPSNSSETLETKNKQNQKPKRRKFNSIINSLLFTIQRMEIETHFSSSYSEIDSNDKTNNSDKKDEEDEKNEKDRSRFPFFEHLQLPSPHQPVQVLSINQTPKKNLSYKQNLNELECSFFGLVFEETCKNFCFGTNGFYGSLFLPSENAQRENKKFLERKEILKILSETKNLNYLSNFLNNQLVPLDLCYKLLSFASVSMGRNELISVLLSLYEGENRFTSSAVVLAASFMCSVSFSAFNSPLSFPSSSSSLNKTVNEKEKEEEEIEGKEVMHSDYLLALIDELFISKGFEKGNNEVGGNDEKKGEKRAISEALKDFSKNKKNESEKEEENKISSSSLTNIENHSKTLKTFTDEENLICEILFGAISNCSFESLIKKLSYFLEMFRFLCFSKLHSICGGKGSENWELPGKEKEWEIRALFLYSLCSSFSSTFINILNLKENEERKNFGDIKKGLEEVIDQFIKEYKRFKGMKREERINSKNKNNNNIEKDKEEEMGEREIGIRKSRTALLLGLCSLKLSLVVGGRVKPFLLSSSLNANNNNSDIMSNSKEEEKKIVKDEIEAIILGAQNFGSGDLEVIKILTDSISFYLNPKLNSKASTSSNIKSDSNKNKKTSKNKKKNKNAKRDKNTKGKINKQIPEICLFSIALIGASNDPLIRKTVSRLIYRIYSQEENLESAFPPSIALLSLSRPEPLLISLLNKLSHVSNPLTSFSSTIALGVIGAGSNNAKISQNLKESESIWEEPKQLFSSKIASGLLSVGKGLFGFERNYNEVEKMSSIVCFLFSLFGPIDNFVKNFVGLFDVLKGMEAKFVVAVDEEGNFRDDVKVRVGKEIGDLGKENISGGMVVTVPVIRNADEEVEIIDERVLKGDGKKKTIDSSYSKVHGNFFVVDKDLL